MLFRKTAITTQLAIIFLYFLLACTSIQVNAAQINVDAGSPGEHIPKTLWGNNLVWYSFFRYYDTHRDVPDYIIKALKEIGVPSLRYPGGIESDLFYWEQSIGPKEKRPVMRQFDDSIQFSQPRHPAVFGVDEFLRLCRKLGAEPQFTVIFRRLDGPNLRIEPESRDLPDAGSEINTELNIIRDGYYRFHVNCEPLSGQGDPYMQLLIDGEMAPLLNLPGSPQAAGMRSGVVRLSSGKHTLTLRAVWGKQRVNWLEVQELNHDNAVKRAQAWVAYCNGDANDKRIIGVDEAGIDWKTVGYWASLRGNPDYGNHPAPYKVRNWEIGNESWGADTFGLPLPDPWKARGEGNWPDPNLYCAAWMKFNTAMKAIDPSIRVSLCGNSDEGQGGGKHWYSTLIEKCGSVANYVHFHPYYPFDRENEDPEYIYWSAMASFKGIDYTINNYRNLIKKHCPQQLGKIKLSASEWSPSWGWGNPLMDNTVRMTGTLAAADMMGTFTNHLDLMDSAQYWFLLASQVSPFGETEKRVTPGWLFKHGLFYVFQLFNHHYGNRRIKAEVSTDCPKFSYVGFGDALPAGEYPLISAYASRDASGYYLIVINKDPTTAHKISVNWKHLQAGNWNCTVRTIKSSGSIPNYRDINTPENQAIKMETKALSGFKPSMEYTFPPCSITHFEIRAKAPTKRSGG